MNTCVKLDAAIRFAELCVKLDAAIRFAELCQRARRGAGAR